MQLAQVVDPGMQTEHGKGQISQVLFCVLRLNPVSQELQTLFSLQVAHPDIPEQTTQAAPLEETDNPFGHMHSVISSFRTSGAVHTWHWAKLSQT